MCFCLSLSVKEEGQPVKRERNLWGCVILTCGSKNLPLLSFLFFFYDKCGILLTRQYIPRTNLIPQELIEIGSVYQEKHIRMKCCFKVLDDSSFQEDQLVWQVWYKFSKFWKWNFLLILGFKMKINFYYLFLI